MQLSTLNALSPLDGRYAKKVDNLRQYFSEFALIKFRVEVEIKWLISLSDEKAIKEVTVLSKSTRESLQKTIQSFSEVDAAEIKKIEETTNHDVKAVEYFIKNALDNSNAGHLKEWVHFGLTSQDINNTAIPLSWKEAMENNVLPAYINLQNNLFQLAKKWKKVSLLARTHGQAASPTTLGKEIMVFVERLHHQIELFASIPYAAKFGGATGNFNAHHIAFPKKNWVSLGNEFVNDVLGLQRMQFTTQIEHYDHFAAQCDTLKRLNNILIDFSRDIWTYISMDYFKQQTKKGEVGSSAMPHKVNPIDFENAEGNLGLANALFEHLANKLPISRLQRDLSDSTVLRNLGVPVAHTLIAFRSIEKGLSKLLLNDAKIYEDLDSNWAVVAEAIQTILRREKYPNPYEALKDLTRGQRKIDQKTIHRFVDSLQISATLKKELKQITPHNYTGVHAPID